MGILVHQELIQLIRDGVIEAPESAVGPSSVDVTLGVRFLRERVSLPWRILRLFGIYKVIDPAKGQRPEFEEVFLNTAIRPGDFCLAVINEKVNLPAWLSDEFRLTSTEARCGIQHALAVWADCGWSGRLTLELSNALKYHSIRLSEGMRIGQLIFHKHAVSNAPYNGRYQGDETVSAGKGEGMNDSQHGHLKKSNARIRKHMGACGMREYCAFNPPDIERFDEMRKQAKAHKAEIDPILKQIQRHLELREFAKMAHRIGIAPINGTHWILIVDGEEVRVPTLTEKEKAS